MPTTTDFETAPPVADHDDGASPPARQHASAEVTRLFVGLTPDRVLAAVEAAGLETTGLCYPLNSFENRVYEVELADRSRVVAKFYRPGRWSREQILEEHAFLAELAEEEVPVCPVRPFPDGETLAEIDGILYALWDRFGGRAPDELGDAGVARLGRLAARIHSVGARRPALARPHLDADRYVRQPLAWMLEHGILPRELRRSYAQAARAIAEIHDERAEGVERLRIHADLHLGNLLFRDGVLRVLDFDDMATGPAVQDLWLAVGGRDEESLRQRGVLLAAYREMRDLDPSTLDLVEPLRGLRLVRYAGWLARRWHDPAFRAGWPDFGTDEWWRQQTRDLEAQLRHIRREAPARVSIESATVRRLEPDEDPSELTNADYFWDWEGEGEGEEG